MNCASFEILTLYWYIPSCSFIWNSLGMWKKVLLFREFIFIEMVLVHKVVLDPFIDLKEISFIYFLC